ncbi:MAG: class I SAM-dependent RNA methyltransferase [Bacilli bacterium]|nr:class I SAM-dependent RNA methyltransferase [Bacilli bacterium]
MKCIIERMDHMGKGIGYIDGKIIFVPKTIPGDEVEITNYEEHKKYARATTYEIINSSNDRKIAFCPYYDKCGGCHLQNLSYEKTLEYKKDRVANILSRANINNEIEVIKNDFPINYRNKIELKVIDGRIGFYESKSHELIEIKECKITKEAINKFIPLLKDMELKNGDVTLRCNYNDELLVWIKTEDALIINEKTYPDYKVVGIIKNNERLYGEDHFLDKVGNMFFEVSYDSFFQVNQGINEKLFGLIKDNVSGDVVLDLYSGVGTLSIMASQNASKVYAIENIPNAVINAIKNAKINNVKNTNFILGNVEDKIKYIEDEIDTVIVDPPRSGLDDVTINKVLELSPDKVIYISCETQKFAEDIKKFKDKYEVSKLYILDMFSFTYHVEVFCVLTKKMIKQKL